ncbi:MAG: DUF5131 family protein [Candidatus Neomarinimicrobiota bacterium]
MHQCSYCYVRSYRDLPVEPTLRVNDFPNLGVGRTIFVGHQCDMFSENTPAAWVQAVYRHCLKYPNNKYVFQTKNPIKLVNDFGELPTNFMIGTTIETNRKVLLEQFSRAPAPEERAIGLSMIHGKKFVTVEPIMIFDLHEFVDLLKVANPDWINIGADSKGHCLPEPTMKEIRELINELNIAGIRILEKMNLGRLI